MRRRHPRRLGPARLARPQPARGPQARPAGRDSTSSSFQPVEELEPVPVTDEDVDRGVAEREAWLAERRAAQAARRRKPREIEIASSRERARGPLAAEVATFDAALVIGQGPPIPIGDAVHMVMERVTLPDAHDLEQIADDVCKEGAITARPRRRDLDVPRLP